MVKHSNANKNCSRSLGLHGTLLGKTLVRYCTKQPTVRSERFKVALAEQDHLRKTLTVYQLLAFLPMALFFPLSGSISLCLL